MWGLWALTSCLCHLPMFTEYRCPSVSDHANKKYEHLLLLVDLLKSFDIFWWNHSRGPLDGQ